eukprot:XP_001610153.1 hypothetical protein [Babesia bovis T2Bo]
MESMVTGCSSVDINQRVTILGRVCSVLWQGKVPRSVLNRYDHGDSCKGSLDGVSEPESDLETDEISVIGVEWDIFRFGNHNGTVDGTFYFSPRLALAFQRAIAEVYNVYIDHGNDWIRDNIWMTPAESMVRNYGGSTCSFVEASKVDTGISLSSAIYDCYVCDDVENADTLDKTPHGAGQIGHEFVGRSDALSFFSDTSNLVSLGLERRRISHLGDCSEYKFTRLRDINLSYNLIYDWDFVRKVLSLIPRTSTLNLSGNLISTNKGPIVSDKLKTLVLSRTMVSSSDLEILLNGLPSLDTLVLCNNAFTELPTFMETLHLSSLDCSENYIWNWWSVLNLVSSSKSLTKLVLSNNKLSNVCMDPATRSQLSIYTAGMQLSGGNRDAYTHLRELYLDDNYIYDWKTVCELSVLFQGLRVLRFNHCTLGNKTSDTFDSLDRQVLIAIFPNLEVLNGVEINKFDRINAERYYITLEHSGRAVFDDTNAHVGLPISHLSRLSAIHGSRDPGQSTASTSAIRSVEVSLIPDGDSDSFLKPAVKRRLPLSTTVMDVKMLCSKLFGMDMRDIILVYNNGSMPISERMIDNDSDLFLFVLSRVL